MPESSLIISRSTGVNSIRSGDIVMGDKGKETLFNDCQEVLNDK